MTQPFLRFRQTIIENGDLLPVDPALLLSNEGNYATHYAPFEHVNPDAKIVLLGITPGTFQAGAALQTSRQALLAGLDDIVALARAKSAASFSGPMRTNLVQLLDAVGVHQALGIATCADLFEARGDLVHFTSALRYPVFVSGANYSGTPGILATPYLKAMMDTWLREEATQLASALWVPLGREPSAVLTYLVEQGVLPADRVLAGLPHPSGANAERIAYFLGRKSRSALSSRTSADGLDLAREQLIEKVARVRGLSTIPGQASGAAVVSPLVADPAKLAVPAVAAVDTRDSTSRPLTSRDKAAQAEDLIARHFERIRLANKKIAGFETGKGRQLAVERGLMNIHVWTEDLESPTALGVFERYPASRSRNSNLAAQAPRVAAGEPAKLWRIEDVASLEVLLDWYSLA